MPAYATADRGVGPLRSRLAFGSGVRCAYNAEIARSKHNERTVANVGVVPYVGEASAYVLLA